jgi:uncharacterized protein
MRLINLVMAASTIILIIGGINILLLMLLHPTWWARKYVKIPILLMPFLSISSTVLWAIGYADKAHFIASLGAILTPALFILEVSLLISLPISSIVYSMGRIRDYFIRKKNIKADFSSRRQLLKNAAVIFPAISVTSGLGGVIDSYSSIKVPIKYIPVKNLPNSLLGLKIAHLSDIHLGYYVHLEELQSAVELIKPHSPHIVLVTGDISDDLEVLPDALSIINRLKPRYGIYASVGNHEYYRGIEEVLRIFASGPFPIIINQHINIQIGSSLVTLGGADDPRTLRRDHTEFLENTIDHTMNNARPDSFKLLMCHRPEGFNHSVNKGINLVLSGHTHGGQVGFAGRSAFEPIFPDKYLWGTYCRGNTTLYTSGGMGHWMPFRLGVPAEAPILILQKA